MKRVILLILAIFITMIVTACATSNSSNSGSNSSSNSSSTGSASEGNTETPSEGGTLTMAWYPNESGADLMEARDELGKIVEDATGMKVEHRTTTDYNIAIESIANGNADLAFMGAQGYIEANKRNSGVQPLVVPSGGSGTLEDAVYYSWIAVKKGKEDEYMNGSDFSIDNIEGKRFSFVSTTSTSGFVVPSNGIINHFGERDEWKDLTSEDLLEGGSNMFFSDVSYGSSHQGTLVNLLIDRADAVAICDSCVANYIELVDGEENRPGAVYRVRDDADEPFNTLPGEEFVLISVTPVLNAPFAVNTDTVSAELIEKIIVAFTSDDVANNERVFVPSDSDMKGLFAKRAEERFVRVEDAWFNPIRELSK